MIVSNRRALILAVHPSAKGFGWVLFEDGGPVDWGIATAREHRNARSMRRFARLLDQYEPSALVLERFEGPQAHRSERIQELATEMQGAAIGRDIATYIYPRTAIGRAILGDARASRHRIAQNVARRIPFLAPRLPKARRLWSSEDSRQSLFDAAALALTHLQMKKSR